MVKPGMFVESRMGGIARQQTQLVIEQDERQRQRERQIGQQRADRQEAMKMRLSHNRITG